MVSGYSLLTAISTGYANKKRIKYHSNSTIILQLKFIYFSFHLFSFLRNYSRGLLVMAVFAMGSSAGRGPPRWEVVSNPGRLQLQALTSS
jgi:hypothetical protein